MNKKSKVRAGSKKLAKKVIKTQARVPAKAATKSPRKAVIKAPNKAAKSTASKGVTVKSKGQRTRPRLAVVPAPSKSISRTATRQRLLRQVAGFGDIALDRIMSEGHTAYQRSAAAADSSEMNWEPSTMLRMGLGWLSLQSPAKQQAVWRKLATQLRSRYAKRYLEACRAYVSQRSDQFLPVDALGDDWLPADEIYSADRRHPQQLALCEQLQNLIAHGTGSGRQGLSFLLNIILEGEVTWGAEMTETAQHHGGVDASSLHRGPMRWGGPEVSAGPHGPYYVLLDDAWLRDNPEVEPLPRSAHVAYLVPDGHRPRLLLGLEKARQRGLISEAEKKDFQNKIVTFGDCLDWSGPPPKNAAAFLKRWHDAEESASMGED